VLDKRRIASMGSIEKRKRKKNGAVAEQKVAAGGEKRNNLMELKRASGQAAQKKIGLDYWIGEEREKRRAANI